MDNKQIQKDSTQIDSSYQQENKVNSQQKVTKIQFHGTVNLDIEQTYQATQNVYSTIEQSQQPQEQSQNTEQESEENPQQLQKFSDFLQKKERHKQVMKIIQEGKEAKNIKNYFTILNFYLKSTNVDYINKKLKEISLKSEASLLNSEIFESLKNQNIQFVDDRDRFEPLNDGQIIAIQFFHYCVIELEDKGKTQNSISLNNPVNINWIKLLPQVKKVNQHFIRLQNLEHEKKFQELSGDKQFESFFNLKLDIFDLLTSILNLLKQKNQSDPEFESQDQLAQCDVDEIAQCFVDEIIIQLKSINNKEFYHFLNQAIYNAVDEIQLLQYFDGKLENPIENLGQDIRVPVNFSEDLIVIQDNKRIAGNLKLSVNDQEQKELDEYIKDFLQTSDLAEDEFINFLLETFEKLQDMRPQVITYLQNFKASQSFSNDSINLKDNLIEIKDFFTKRKIIEWLKSNEKVPSKLICKKDYGLNQDQMGDFQKCFQKLKVISFKEHDLFPEEIQYMFKIFITETNFQKISDLTLIEIQLVRKFFIRWTQQLNQETEILELLLFYGHGKDISFYVELILNDNQNELLKVLLMIYKKCKKDYQKVTAILSKYTIKFENFELQKLIRLAKDEDLSENSKKQEQVNELRKYFLKNDIIVYLMILNELWIKGEPQQYTSYFEEIILQEKHQKIIPAVAQLLILDKCPQLKAEVAEKRFFIDHKNDQFKVEKQLEEQLKLGIQLEESNEDSFFSIQISKRSESDNTQLVDTIKRLANITNKKIKIHQMSELKHFMVYSPEKEMNQSTLLLVRDELQKVFHVMIQYDNEKKIIDFSQLQDLKKKLPFLNDDLPRWLDIFIQLPSLRRVLQEEQDVDKHFKEERVINLLESITKIQQNYLQCKNTKNKKELQKVATQLWNLDNQLLQEWFYLQQKNERMSDFCSYMITSSARQNSYWAFNQVSSLQEYFPMNPIKMSLEDFNRVQTRSELNQRKETIQHLKDQPKELARSIINTIFGFILRKEDLSVIQSELQSVVKSSPISLRFLIAYLIQSSDLGLRARLGYYLCQNKAVPLIMNCQETYQEQNFNMKYNQELVFSIDQVEGVGVFSLGIGKMATYPCGKSQIANMIVTPKFENKSFDTNDVNVLSNGQIDLFLEKCYQKKNGWAYMDGQGEIPNKNLQSVLPLTNIILIHFFEQDSTDKISVNLLTEKLKIIKDSDSEILICLILRDCSETKEFTRSEYPEWLPMKDQVDKLISLVDLNEVNKQNKINEIEKVLLYFNTKVREIQQIGSIKSKCKFTKERFLIQFCQSDERGKTTYQHISEILQLSEEFLLEVQKLDQNVFNENGLPSLKIKDEIREITLKLRSFSVQEEEDQESAFKREKQLLDQINQLNTQQQELDINILMQKFWQIVINKDAVLIKIEISKGLANFTQKKTSHLIKKKDQLLKENGTITGKKEEGLTYKQIQDANNKFQEEIKKIEEEIF